MGWSYEVIVFACMYEGAREHSYPCCYIVRLKVSGLRNRATALYFFIEGVLAGGFGLKFGEVHHYHIAY
jgi:hypothetical protein